MEVLIQFLRKEKKEVLIKDNQRKVISMHKGLIYWGIGSELALITNLLIVLAPFQASGIIIPIGLFIFSLIKIFIKK